MAVSMAEQLLQEFGPMHCHFFGVSEGHRYIDCAEIMLRVILGEKEWKEIIHQMKILAICCSRIRISRPKPDHVFLTSFIYLDIFYSISSVFFLT